MYAHIILISIVTVYFYFNTLFKHIFFIYLIYIQIHKYIYRKFRTLLKTKRKKNYFLRNILKKYKQFRPKHKHPLSTFL